VISRKDIDNIYTNHVLHSLAIACFIHFAADSSLLDLGTGGGFPGIPLAIFYPECRFTMIDGRGKKISVVQDVIKNLDLKNATAIHQRA
jgi:16S rRNA (guanine527-N7)-methyltransferase